MGIMTTVTTSRDVDDPSYPAVFDLVKADVIAALGPNTPILDILEERNQFGLRKYGVPLRPFDGNNPLREAFQEFVDFVVYLRQGIYELDSPMSELLRSIYQPALRDLEMLYRLVTVQGTLENSQSISE